MKFSDATMAEIDAALVNSAAAFNQYKKLNLKARASFLHSVAQELEAKMDNLIETAHQETNLEKDRLKVELRRTIFQLSSYGDACADGTWLDIRIDAGKSESTQPRPDLRKMAVPLGPVVVFGASNFPFAYSTAGGDTASALAAGCSVIIKAHPAHAETSENVALAIQSAARKHNLSEGVFIHLHGAAFEVGKALVQHPLTKAVGFTGSYEGGKALFDLAAQRPIPIPVFAEMGSVNPVFILPEKLAGEIETIANMYAASITQSAGQFCTNPGILVSIKSKSLEAFKTQLGNKIRSVQPVKMLHPGIAKSFQQKRLNALQEGATIIATNDVGANEDESIPTLATVSAEVFLQNPLLHKEVFGPYSLLVECESYQQLFEVASAMEGQLTCTLLATEAEAKDNEKIIDMLKEKCGRFIFNGVPTGVEVALSMHHGGPFPATTDSRFTAVGADAIKRFARQFCFQNWPDALLPDELKNGNPLNLWRTVNNKLTKDAI